MYTVDTSVWVNAFDLRRAEHSMSLTLLDRMEAMQIPIYVPNLLLAEIASAISRSRSEVLQGRIFASAIRNFPHVHLVLLDDALAERTAEIAADYRLRAADALYVAVALQTNSILVSLDNEQRTRVASLLNTQTPEQALAAFNHTKE